MQADPKLKSQELTGTATNESQWSQIDQPTAAFKPDSMAETASQEGNDSTQLWSSAGHIVSANDVDLTATFDTSATSVSKQKATQKVIGGYEILGESPASFACHSSSGLSRCLPAGSSLAAQAG